MSNHAPEPTLPALDERRARARALSDVERAIAIGLIQGKPAETITAGISISFGLPTARVEREFRELRARLKHMGLID